MKAFCPTCGWADFCRTDCRATTARVRYAQRTQWAAMAMLATASNDEQRAYYGTRLAEAAELLKVPASACKVRT